MSENNPTLHWQQLSGPDILEIKVMKAIKTKSCSCYNVYAEVLKLMDTKHITYLCNIIYDTVQVTTDLLKSKFLGAHIQENTVITFNKTK